MTNRPIPWLPIAAVSLALIISATIWAVFNAPAKAPDGSTVSTVFLILWLWYMAGLFKR